MTRKPYSISQLIDLVRLLENESKLWISEGYAQFRKRIRVLKNLTRGKSCQGIPDRPWAFLTFHFCVPGVQAIALDGLRKWS